MPCILWLTLKRPSMASPYFWACCFIIPVCSIAGLLGAIGSVHGMVVLSSTFKTFS